MGFLSGSGVKEFACNAGDTGSIPGSGRSPGDGNDYPLKYSCLENPMDRGCEYKDSLQGRGVPLQETWKTGKIKDNNLIL